MTDLNALADRLGIDRDTAAVLLQVVKSTHPLFLKVPGGEWVEATVENTSYRPSAVTP